MRNPWIIAQLAVAAVLLAISLLGIIGTVVFNLPELAFSFRAASRRSRCSPAWCSRWS